MGEGKRRGFFFFFFGEIGLLWLREERLTDFLVGVGKPQHILSGSSALEAS
jgi:hypothetical protein